MELFRMLGGVAEDELSSWIEPDLDCFLLFTALNLPPEEEVAAGWKSLAAPARPLQQRSSPPHLGRPIFTDRTTAMNSCCEEYTALPDRI